MANESLKNYVLERIRAGQSQTELKQHLKAVGGLEDEINDAIVAGLMATGVPVPDRGGRTVLGKKASTMEIIVNFFSFILLGIVATAQGVLFFQIINRYFPDKLVLYYNSMGDISPEAIHYAIAALIVGFPLYYWAMRLWFHKFHDEEGKIESRLTKWLTY